MPTCMYAKHLNWYSWMPPLNCPTFVLSAGSAAAAVLLGVDVVSDESASTIAAGSKSDMPSSAFYGHGCETGPELFLMDEQASQSEALRQVRPCMRQLLCLFRKGGGDGYGKRCRILILKTERTLCTWRKLAWVYASSPLEIYHDITNNPTFLISLYPNVEERIRDMWQEEEEWALAHRFDLTTRGKHTNNYSEASMRILKDHVFLW